MSGQMRDREAETPQPISRPDEDPALHDQTPTPTPVGPKTGAWLAGLPPQGRGVTASRAALVLQLQQTLGNRAVQRLLQRRLTQPEPTPPAADEHLADRIRTADVGRPLEPAVKGQLEQGLGADLSRVRVHTDSEADRLAQTVDAVAFTSGEDVFFRSGAYDPNSQAGLQTLAHETTHVLQQARGPVSGTATPSGVLLSDPADAFEQAAHQAADHLVRGGRSATDAVVPASAPPAWGAGLSSLTTMHAETPVSVQRDMAGAMSSVAQGSETAVPDEGTLGARVMGVSNVGDVSAARSLRTQLDSVDADLQTAVHSGDVPGAAYTENNNLKEALDTYLARAGVQSATMGTFQAEFLRLMRDKDRFDQKVALYESTSRGQQLGQQQQSGAFATPEGGTAFASALVQSVGVTDADRHRMQNVGSGNGSINLSDAQRLHDEMMEASGAVWRRRTP